MFICACVCARECECVRSCACAYSRTSVRTSVRACARACVRACAVVCARVRASGLRAAARARRGGRCSTERAQPPRRAAPCTCACSAQCPAAPARACASDPHTDARNWRDADAVALEARSMQSFARRYNLDWGALSVCEKGGAGRQEECNAARKWVSFKAIRLDGVVSGAYG
eukprot:3855934-Pleurochrysis_carterae.AAC.3